MKFSKLILLIAIAVIVITLPTTAHASDVSVTITPTSQIVNQGGLVTYTVGLGGSAMELGTTFALSLSALPSGSSYSFSPNPVTLGLGTTSTLTIDLSRSGVALYCPGSYSFSVTATNTTDLMPPSTPPPVDSGSASASLNVVQVGPPLQVTVSTDKGSYVVGDTVNVQMSVNRPAEGTLAITPPSGPPVIFTYVFSGPTYTLAKSFTAQQTGRYTVNLQADDFCSGFSSAIAYFDISPNTYQVSISLSGVPPQVSAGIQVDGQSSGTIGGSDIKSLSFGINTSHTIAVDQYVTGSTGSRYFAAQNSWTVNSGGSHTFSYQAQYLLTVATDPNGITQISGGGWYNAGSTVQTGTATSSLTGSAGTQYAFQTWQVDGAAQTGNPITITLNGPHTVTAVYQTQYQLTIDSPYGNPQGAGWYAAGSTATFSVTSPSGILIQQVFVQWQGDYTGSSPQGSVVMDAPKIVHAMWTTSYTQLYAALGAIVAIAAASVILWRRRSGGAPTTKPTPSGTEPGTPGEGGGGGPINCPSCGTENAAGQVYCTNCGAQLSTATPPPSVSEVALPDSTEQKGEP